MAKLKHTFKNDMLFKLLFTKNPHLLERFVSRLLNIPPENIRDFKVVNPEMPPNIIDNKLCRLDILMEVDGQQVNIEVQVEDEGNFPERVLFHWARAYSNALTSGRNFKELPRTILINILGFSLFKDYDGYHSEFQVLEVTRHVSLSDKMAIHFFELEKLPEEVNKDDIPLVWLQLFKADTEEELQMSSDTELAEVNEVITAYRNLMASAEFREYERQREKAELDERQRTNNAVVRAAEEATKKATEETNKKWQSVVDEKDAEIVSKDAELSAKDAEIAELKAKLSNT